MAFDYFVECRVLFILYSYVQLSTGDVVSKEQCPGNVLLFLLWFDHHPTVHNLSHGLPLVISKAAGQASPLATIIPPTTSTVKECTIWTIKIIVVVIGGEFHTVVIVAAKTSVTVITFILERVSGVSTVSSHFQSIFVVELITNLE